MSVVKKISEKEYEEFLHFKEQRAEVRRKQIEKAKMLKEQGYRNYSVRFSPDEVAQITEKAAQQNISIAKYIHDIVLDALLK